MSQLTLYDYYRSSSAYRVRIALNIKAVEFQKVDINLLEEAHFDKNYLSLNPQRLVPTLDTGADIISQSLAIIEWLDETYPHPALLPTDPVTRARVKSLSYAIAMDIQPLNNLRVQKYLRQAEHWNDEQINNWYQHWIATGFSSLETQLATAGCNGKFCFGDSATMADICLVPQVYNAERFHCDLSHYPLIRSVVAHCNSLQAFIRATPEAVKP